MGGVGHKLFLNFPCLLHRVNGPSRQQQAEEKESQQAGGADADTGPNQAVHGILLGCGIGKDHQQGIERAGLVVPQVVIPDDTGLVSAVHHANQLPQKFLVGQIIAAAVGDNHNSGVVDLQRKVRNTAFSRGIIGAIGMGGILGNRLHEHHTFLLQPGMGKGEQHTEDNAHHYGDDAHRDTNKANTELFQHPPFTSR